jgi:hypothetical protein
MKYFEKSKGKGKVFAPFAQFASFTRLQRSLFAAATVIAALFFASCGNFKDANELLDNLNIPDIPSTLPTLSIKGESPYILQGGSTAFTVTLAGVTVPSKLSNLQVKGKQDADTRIKDGKLLVGNNEPAGELTITGGYESVVGNSTVAVVGKTTVTVVANVANKSIKDKFGVKAAGEDGVTATFTALHNFIQAGGLTNNKTNDVIKTGDWIDLEGGLKVNEYNYLGYFEYAGTVQASNGTPLLRLIVVGINSFQSSGVPGGYTYQGEETPPPQHVVFQFQNVPVIRRMNISDVGGGYPSSEARKYLVPVTENGFELAGSGNFLDGLLEAGVPNTVLWAPGRVLGLGVNGTGSMTVSDKLWLPTESEMFGVKSYSPDSETAANQARLEYYKTDESRKKYTEYNAVTYWGASPSYHTVGGFQDIVPSGNVDGNDGIIENGIVPAFCVQ